MTYLHVFENQKAQKYRIVKPKVGHRGMFPRFMVFLVVLGIFAYGFAGGRLVAMAADGDPVGSVNICKIILDQGGNIIDGSIYPGTTFTISGFTPSPVTSEGPPVGELPATVFTTPLILDSDLVSSNGIDDAQCVKHGSLSLGGYYYGQETISNSGWLAPKYNDQFSFPVATLSDFFAYDSNLFDGNAGNDATRNLNVDGHIVLTPARPSRTLIVLNQIAPTKLTVIKQVVNDDNGTSTPADFSVHVKSGNTDITGSPQAGSATGTAYTLNAGTYIISEDLATGYSATFSGDCNESGNVILNFGDDKICTITNNDIKPQDQGGSGERGGSGGSGGGSSGGTYYPVGNPSVSAPGPTQGQPQSGVVAGVQAPALTPPPQVEGITLPRTGTSFELWSLMFGLIILGSLVGNKKFN